MQLKIQEKSMTFATIIFEDGTVNEVPEVWIVTKDDKTYCWWPRNKIKWKSLQNPSQVIDEKNSDLFEVEVRGYYGKLFT